VTQPGDFAEVAGDFSRIGGMSTGMAGPSLDVLRVGLTAWIKMLRTLSA